VTDEEVILRVITELLERGGVKYFITGSIAAMYYGESRMTRDVDIVVHLKYADIDFLAQVLSPKEFYFDRAMAIESLQCEGNFNLIHHATGMKVDVMCKELEGYEATRFQRSRRVEILPGVFGFVSAPEDVILKKLQFYQQGESDKHLRDIASMMKVSGEDMDRAYLDDWAAKLGVTSEWDEMKRRCGWSEQAERGRT